jgi:hypothetical protein
MKTSARARRTGFTLAFVLACVGLGCSTNTGVKVVFYKEQDFTFSRTDTQRIRAIATKAVPEVRKLLSDLPRDVIIRVFPRTLQNESGSNGEPALPNVMYWYVDARSPEGVATIAARSLRPTIYHELHHLVRLQTESTSSTFNRVVSEGLAAAFERDFAHVRVPFGEYPPTVTDWLAELTQLPESERHEYLARDDGDRKWILNKIGTYIADRAIRRSGRSAAALVRVPTDDVLNFAATRVNPTTR